MEGSHGRHFETVTSN